MQTSLQSANYQFQTPKNVWSPTARIESQCLMPFTPRKKSIGNTPSPLKSDAKEKDNEMTPIRKIKVTTLHHLFYISNYF